MRVVRGDSRVRRVGSAFALYLPLSLLLIYLAFYGNYGNYSNK